MLMPNNSGQNIWPQAEAHVQAQAAHLRSMLGIAEPQPPGVILGPDGKPFTQKYDPYNVPHVIQFSAIINAGWRKYWMEKHDLALRHSREDAMAMRRDSALQCLMRESRRAVVNLPWHIEVENEKDPHEKCLKDGLTKLVQMTPRLKTLLWYLSDAKWYGRYGAQLRYGFKAMDMPAPQSRMTMLMNPDASMDPMKRVTGQRKILTLMRSSDDNGHMPTNGDKIGHSFSGEPFVLVQGASDDQLPLGLPPEWCNLGRAVSLAPMRESWIIHKYQEGIEDADWWDAEAADSVNGVGVRSSIYFMDYLKKEWISRISDFLEVAVGLRLWYYRANDDESRKAVSQAAKENTHRVNILIPRFGDQRSGMPAEGMEWKEATGSGTQLMMDMLRWVEEWHERFIIGQSMSGGVRGGERGHSGSLGGSHWAELAADTKADVVQSDAEALAETMTLDYVNVLKKYSYPEYAEIPAYFRFGLEHKEVDKKLDAAQKAWSMGASLKEHEVIEAAGFTAPTTGDKVLKSPQLSGQGGPAGQDQQIGGDPGTENQEQERQETKEQYHNAVRCLADHFKASDLPQAMYGLDLEDFIDRLKQINTSEAIGLYRHLLNVLQRYPDLRAEVGLRTLATIRGLA